MLRPSAVLFSTLPGQLQSVCAMCVRVSCLLCLAVKCVVLADAMAIHA